jgi:hypothetical protein
MTKGWCQERLFDGRDFGADRRRAGESSIAVATKRSAVDVLLKTDERGGDLGGAAELGDGFAHGAVLQVEEVGQLGFVELVAAFADILGQDEIEEGLQLLVVG